MSTVICKWKDNKKAAYSLCADDSSAHHLNFMIPEMKKHGFRGTFWVNPNKNNTWTLRHDEWLDAAAYGCDFANHTIHHKGARSYGEAEFEIAESARIIREANPSQTLLLFLNGGATVWTVSDADLNELLYKYQCVKGRGGGMRFNEYHVVDGKYVSATVEEMASYPAMALESGEWRMNAFHHVGPGATNLPTDAEPFIALMDALDRHRSALWIDTNTNIHKYVTERDAARIDVVERTSDRMIVSLKAGLNTYMYNYPLTLQTGLSDGWENGAAIEQNGVTVKVPYVNGMCRYEARPDHGAVIIHKVT